MNKKKSSIWGSISGYVILIGLVIIVLLVPYGIYRYATSDSIHFSVFFIPLFFGLVYESKRLGSSIEEFCFKIGTSLVGSFIILLFLWIDSDSSMEKALESWPILFIVGYTILSMQMFEKKVTQRLTEGITLMYSIAFFYWAFDFGFFEEGWIISVLVIFTALIFVIGSLFFALTHFALTETIRLILSLGSSCVILIFAIEHTYRVYQLNDQVFENTTDLSIAVLQFFLLGVSAVYMTRNFFLVFTYLPDKNHFYGEEHLRSIKKRNKEHIARYSEEQVNILDSLICVVFFCAFFSVNYTYKYVPRHTSIWIAIFIFPILVELKNRVIYIVMGEH